MKSPFEFGSLVRNETFINREKETKKLKINFVSGINTMLISPRRWGKSSLVEKAANECALENPNIRICFIDMFEVMNEKKFYEVLAREILKCSSSRWDEWAENAKKFLKQIIPVFSFGLDPQTDFNLKFEWADNEVRPDLILNLSERIAEEKGLQFVICIDEFQKIAQFEHSLQFQQTLRAVWQRQKNTSYCLYGSKRHVINELFTNQSMPFYKFGDIIFLPKIEEKHWRIYIDKVFNETGKIINTETINALINRVQNHPFHIQQLAHQVWINTTTEATLETIEEAINELHTYHNVVYSREIDNLTPLQVRYLEAIVKGETKLTAKETIKKYDLGTPGNVPRLKKAIEDKEIVDFFEKKPCFIDPLFELWFKKTFRL